MSLFLLTLTFCNGQQKDSYELQRLSMVQNQIADRGITNQNILKAFKKVPRHKFIPVDYISDAYDDHPLPIGYQQTISQPYVVAYMTDAVKASKGKKGLEIGTGSGYQAAILAELIDSVYTIEIVPELAKRSSELLGELGYKNIKVKQGDGYKGWSQHAPFDLIIVQLNEGGLLVIPVGEQDAVQQLILLEKKNGKVDKKVLSYVRFVPFTRE
jgi:protein-L-isoaspartate(D-aspartate) O-methyltransferase